VPADLRKLFFFELRLPVMLHHASWYETLLHHGVATTDYFENFDVLLQALPFALLANLCRRFLVLLFKVSIGTVDIDVTVF
jgi:hypothetical protein